MFLEKSRPFDIDVMLEIKEKERAAIRALEIGRNDKRIRVKPSYNPYDPDRLMSA